MSKLKADFGYQAETLSLARSSLIAPHERGEERAFASAFHTCQLAFHKFDENQVDNEHALQWIATIKRLMNSEGYADPTGEGTSLHRARAMTLVEKHDFSKAVDELAHWFDREDWASE
jgi:hypothetical protein